jgi:hypothetical protein
MDTWVVNVRVAHLRREPCPHCHQTFHDLQEWSAFPGHVYIGRGGILVLEDPVTGHKRRYPSANSFWANHHKLGDLSLPEVLARYEQDIRNSPDHLARLASLKGCVLGCWCHPADCHGHVLQRLIAELVM